MSSDGPKDSRVRWSPDPPWEGAILGEKGTHCKVQGHSVVTCAKTAEPNVMPLGLSARSGSRNHELDGGPDPTPREGVILGKTVAHCKV